MRRIAAVMLILLVLAIPLLGCSPDVTMMFQTQLLGSTVTVELFSQQDDSILSQIGEVCKQYALLFSTSDPDSELYGLNSQDGVSVAVSAEMMKAVRLAFYYNELSDGRYDITQRPLLQLWNFDSETPAVPSADDIEQAMENVGLGNVDIGAYTVAVNGGIELDFDGLGRGMAVEKIAAVMRENEAKGIITIDGNTVVVGEYRDGYEVQLDEPFEAPEPLGSIFVNDMAVVTADMDDRSFRVDGQLYGGYLDATTGKPADTDLLSVTVIAPSAAQAYALSEVCMRIGYHRSIDVIAKTPDVSAVFVTDGYVTRVTGGFTAEFFPQFNGAYTEQVK